MPNEYDKITDILIRFSNALGYDGTNKDHFQAYMTARGELEDLIDEIDNAERC